MWFGLRSLRLFNVCVCFFWLWEFFTSHLCLRVIYIYICGVFSKDGLLFSRFPCSAVIGNLSEDIRSGLGLAHLPCLHHPHAVSVFSTVWSLGCGRAEGLSPASQKCLFPADGHKRRGKKGFEAGQSQSVRLNVALTVSSSFRDSPRHSLSGWLFVSPVRRRLVNSPPWKWTFHMHWHN